MTIFLFNYNANGGNAQGESRKYVWRCVKGRSAELRLVGWRYRRNLRKGTCVIRSGHSAPIVRADALECLMRYFSEIYYI